MTSNANVERRQDSRFVSLLRACCVQTKDGIDIALMRNISAGGAQLEGEIAEPVGATIRYSVDERFWIEAEIAWKDGPQVGLANKAYTGVTGKQFPRRAIRLPLRSRVRAWIGGVARQVEIENISQSGARLIAPEQLQIGTAMTLEIGELELHNVTVTRLANDSVGVRFERPIHLRMLKRILDMGRSALGPSKDEDAAENTADVQQAVQAA